MKRENGGIRLSASDLANHLGCRHLTNLNREVAEGRRSKPDFFDPTLATLQARGDAHEAAYVASLRSQGLVVEELSREQPVETTKQQTLEAMKRGVDAIVQATLVSGNWLGYADVLRKVESSERPGEWSYEAYDTKLSRETKAGAVLQLALYSDILEEMQGERPEHMWVVAPGSPFTFDRLRFEDYRAYYRWVRRRLDASVSTSPAPSEPEPVPKCETCNWVRHCESETRKVDHLSFVAGITRSQRRELKNRNVVTLAGLAALGVPLQWKPERGTVESLVKVREQARIQHEGRTHGNLKRELLEPAEGRGLALLPEPSAGDLFFDFEGDPFVAKGGLEYLFGYAERAEGGNAKYHALWALTHAEERRAFETFVDDLTARWQRDPAMHVYHFAPYEPSAMRRLMGRHGTREQEVDRMLRGGLFVDLFTVVRQGLRASVESYSIKRLEPFFNFVRDVPLPEVGASKRALEAALELAVEGQRPEYDEEWRRVVEVYNRDDCLSAMQLRDWLESLREELIAQVHPLSRPKAREVEPSAKLKEAELKRRALRERLLTDVPEDPAARDSDERARALMAALIEFHRREDRVIHSERYRLREVPGEELEDEPRALDGLVFVGTVGGKKVPIHRYSFPSQVIDATEDMQVYRSEAPEDEWQMGTVEALDREALTIDIKKTGKTADVHPSAVYLHKYVSPEPIPQAVFRLGEWIADHGTDGTGAHRAARDLLLARPPRLRGGPEQMKRREEETTTAQAIRLALELDQGVLPVQGPPGAGKTYTGARMIVACVQAGQRVGVTASSYKVLRNLLDEVLVAAQEAGVAVPCGQKLKSGEKPNPDSAVREFDDNAEALASLQDGEIKVLGGVPWLWAKDEAVGCLDILFIDEAGQLSLANALAVAQAASNVVLLGDPRQLEQPKKGAHPDGAEVSALEHLLGHRLTVPEELGLFLEQTWRLHPAIAEFTSSSFYERRLRPHTGLERLSICAGPINASGLWYLPVQHAGRPNHSPEEVTAIQQLLAALLSPETTWSDVNGLVRPVTPKDVLIVAPYNAQVAALTEALGSEFRVGTVDRFQGQEAAVVIISMTASSIEDAPRGMEFLFSPNRLNVATSRAKCACVLVASPQLFEVECRSPRQMQLANALCQYRESAKELR